jgi:hypothetical protein
LLSGDGRHDRKDERTGETEAFHDYLQGGRRASAVPRRNSRERQKRLGGE